MIARRLVIVLGLVSIACFGKPPSPEERVLEAELVNVGTEMFGDLIAEKSRLENVAYRLNRAARSYCGELQRPLVGALLGGSDAMIEEWMQEAGRRQGLGDLLTVLHIVPSGSFARAGLRPGDQVVAFEGQTPRTRSEFGDVVLAAAGLERARVTISRNGQERDLEVELDQGCPIPFKLAAEPHIMAGTGPGGIEVVAPRGLLGYATVDDRLAVPLSHQLAHTLFDQDADSDLEGERRADRNGIRLAGAAGYDISHTVPYWEDTARAYPWLVAPDRVRGRGSSRFRRETTRRAYDHHDLARRMSRIRAAVEESQALLDKARGGGNATVPRDDLPD